METTEIQNSPSPPHQGHRDELLRKSNLLWEGNTLPLYLGGGRSNFNPSTASENDINFSTNNFLQTPADNIRPALDSLSNIQVSVGHYQRLLAEVPILDLIQIVQDRLMKNPSEICTSFMLHNRYI